jgi:hypothetical protein
MDENLEMRALFLKELAQLTLRYGFYIGGCGCCGSPSVKATADTAGDSG